MSENGVKSDLAFCLRPFTEKTNSALFDVKASRKVVSVSVPIVAKAIAVYPTHRLFVAVLFLGQKTVEDAAVVIVVVVVQKAVVVTIVQLRGLSRITRVVRVVGVLGRGLGTPGQVEVLLRWGSDGPGIRPGRRLGEDLGNGRRGTGRDAASSQAGTAGTVTHNTGGDNDAVHH